MRKFQDAPDETQLKLVAEVLDEDHDGNIEIEHLLKVCPSLHLQACHFLSSKYSVYILNKSRIVL